MATGGAGLSMEVTADATEFPFLLCEGGTTVKVGGGTTSETLGVGTAGFPEEDTVELPALLSARNSSIYFANSCT